MNQKPFSILLIILGLVGMMYAGVKVHTSGDTIVYGDGTTQSTGAMSNEYAFIQFNSPSIVIAYNSATKILYTNGTSYVQGNAMQYDMTNSLFRVFRNGKYEYSSQTSLEFNAGPSASAIIRGYIYTNSALEGQTDGYIITPTLCGQIWMNTVLSLESNTTVETYLYNGSAANTGYLSNGLYKTRMMLKYISP